MMIKLIILALIMMLGTGCSDVQQSFENGYNDANVEQSIGSDAKDLSSMISAYGNDVTENSNDLEKVKSISSEYKDKVSKYVTKYSNIENKTKEQQKLLEAFTQFENTLILMENEDIQGASVQLKGLTETCNELTEMYK